MLGKIDRYSVYRRAFGNRFFIAAVSLLVIAIAMKWLVERLDLEIDRAESVQFQMRLAELHSAVTLMKASVVAKRDQDGLEQFVGGNPMDWIKSDAAHYLGVKSLRETDNAAGNWAYDPVLKVIAYMPKGVSRASLLSEAGFAASVDSEPSEKSQEWLRFKVVGLLSKDNNAQRGAKVSDLELIYIEEK